ncbi:MAG: 3-oxoacyl-[acyl-carrier-protein] synthase III C-terminal domain-containing protein [Cyanobacteriota/Melainabacteria group bacterium]
MNGKAIYNFAVQRVPGSSVKTACESAGITVEDVDFLVPHQANIRIIKSAAERLGMSPEQLVTNVDEMGNTSAASIPLALWQAIQRDQIKVPSTICLVGFGAGLTWASAIVRWTARDHRRIQKKTEHTKESTDKRETQEV